jgi:hypothetical protein
MFFTFPEDARWNADLQAVEFGVGVGEYEGVVRVPRRVFRRFLDGVVTPERCVEAYYLQRTRFERTRFERIAERKLRNRQMTDDGIEISGRDLRVPRDARLIGAAFYRRSEREWPQAQS